MKFVARPLLAAGLAVLISQPVSGQTPEFQVGEPFPALKLPSLEDGRLTSLERSRGTPLVLHIWASW